MGTNDEINSVLFVNRAPLKKAQKSISTDANDASALTSPFPFSPSSRFVKFGDGKSIDACQRLVKR
jgi:hypothetical protein